MGLQLVADHGDQVVLHPVQLTQSAYLELFLLEKLFALVGEPPAFGDVVQEGVKDRLPPDPGTSAWSSRPGTRGRRGRQRSVPPGCRPGATRRWPVPGSGPLDVRRGSAPGSSVRSPSGPPLRRPTSRTAAGQLRSRSSPARRGPSTRRHPGRCPARSASSPRTTTARRAPRAGLSPTWRWPPGPAQLRNVVSHRELLIDRRTPILRGTVRIRDALGMRPVSYGSAVRLRAVRPFAAGDLGKDHVCDVSRPRSAAGPHRRERPGDQRVPGSGLAARELPHRPRPVRPPAHPGHPVDL
jgi:hypothetical protein